MAEVDIDNNLIVSKTRYKPLTGAVISKPKSDLGREILAWLESGAPMEDVPREQSHMTITIEEALKRYHAAAAAKLPNEQDREDFLRYAAWKTAQAKHQSGNGPAPVLPSSTNDVPISVIASVVKRIGDLDGQAMLDMLAGWRQEHAETEDAVPDI